MSDAYRVIRPGRYIYRGPDRPLRRVIAGHFGVVCDLCEWWVFVAERRGRVAADLTAARHVFDHHARAVAAGAYTLPHPAREETPA